MKEIKLTNKSIEMFYEKEEMRTIDLTVSSLCDEVDHWKERAAYWEKMYKDARDENIREMNERFEETKKGVGMALMFALTVKDDSEGNLIIKKEDRKTLANHYR